MAGQLNNDILGLGTNDSWHDLDDMNDYVESFMDDGDVKNAVLTLLLLEIEPILSELTSFATQVANGNNTNLTGQMDRLVGFRNRIATATATNVTDWGDDDVNNYLTANLTILEGIVEGYITRVNELIQQASPNRDEKKPHQYAPITLLRF
tara:strand:- start:1041 stop:1493 length:453 start_codon:yes stop_codon:yes gene_type:complete